MDNSHRINIKNTLQSIVKMGLWCMALACTPLCSAAEDEVIVLLGSEHALLPTHICPITAASTDLSQDYLRKLQAILTFDLDHNGMTRIVTGKEKESATAAIHSDGSVDLPALRNLGLSYLIDWKIQGRDLGASVVQITSGTTRSISPVTCSGDLSKDRGRIHQLSDCIYQLLFGKTGIANTKILYTHKKRIANGSSEPTVVSEIFEADYDGQNPRQLTKIGSMSTSPVWVPPRTPGVASADPSGTQKSQTYLYVSYELGQPKIYAASLRDNRVYRVTTMRGNQVTPAISYDGSAIAFCSDITGTADLYVVPFEAGVGAVGKPRQIFHAKGTATGCPAFSPDGSKVAFVSNKDGAAKVYIMDIPPVGAKSADLHPTLIAKRCRESTAPAWSPDGKKIAYSAKNSGERQIWIYDIENRTEQQLTDGKGSKESPSWAPDSMHLAFHAITKDGCDLYMVNINQPTPVKITSGSGEKLFPSWEPRAQ